MTTGQRLSALVLAVFLLPAALQGQSRDGISLVLAGGPTLNDLEVGRTLWLAAASAEWRPRTLPLVLDASVRYLTYTAAEREHYPLVELSAQWEFDAGPVSPFLGGGAGLTWRVRPGETDSEVATHVAGGVRAALGARAGLRAEARLRSVEPLGDFTLGLSWALGRGR